ncbi:MAG: galactose mutarotase [Tannerella sp.]|jgi:aldose 1-epimerase|nr:galactose mutarotase [Tannerella sp.]
MKKIWMILMMACTMLWSCGNREETLISKLKKADFESEVAGKPTALYVLKNAKGMEVCITNYGGRVVSVMVPDRNGKMTDVVLGYDHIADYVASDGNFGALIGRYGNRIARGLFVLDEKEYRLPRNNNGNCLHGGPQGFHVQVWDAVQPDDGTLELSHLSGEGEAGFPGNLNVKVTYKVTDDHALDIRYEATTDRPTVVNLTNHSYFNLSGVAGSQITDHLIRIDADRYTEVDSLLIPTSALPSVEGTPLDLRTPVPLSEGIDSPFEQIKRGKGFDHNWVLNTGGDVTQPAARVVHPISGIVMDIFTNEPGLQLYSGNAMTGTDRGKFGVTYPHRGGLCLETQHYPDSPNQPAFPSTTLRPGENYLSRCIYRFSVL